MGVCRPIRRRIIKDCCLARSRRCGAARQYSFRASAPSAPAPGFPYLMSDPVPGPTSATWRGHSPPWTSIMHAASQQDGMERALQLPAAHQWRLREGRADAAVVMGIPLTSGMPPAASLHRHPQHPHHYQHHDQHAHVNMQQPQEEVATTALRELSMSHLTILPDVASQTAPPLPPAHSSSGSGGHGVAVRVDVAQPPAQQQRPFELHAAAALRVPGVGGDAAVHQQQDRQRRSGSPGPADASAAASMQTDAHQWLASDRKHPAGRLALHVSETST